MFKYAILLKANIILRPLADVCHVTPIKSRLIFNIKAICIILNANKLLI